MQVRVIGKTKLIRCEVYLARAMAARSAELRGFDYYNRFYGAKEHEGLRFVPSIAIAKRYVVVSYFDHIPLVHAAGETPDIHELALIRRNNFLCAVVPFRRSYPIAWGC
jgi:hypothetical protein